MSRTIALAMVVAFALGAVGCGSSSKTSSGTTASSTPATQAKTETQTTAATPRPKPPKEAFARQVFEACQTRDAAFRVFTRRAEQQKPRGEIGDLARAFPPIETARIEAFEAITPPAKFKSRFEQLKAALRQRRDVLAQWGRDNPTGTISKPVIRQIERPGARASELARELRLTCSI